jgi:hypothetical protein
VDGGLDKPGPRDSPQLGPPRAVAARVEPLRRPHGPAGAQRGSGARRTTRCWRR